MHPTNPNSILVAMQFAGTAHAWQLTDTQAANRVWQNVSGSGSDALPDFETYAITRHPDKPDQYWFAGSQGGAMMMLDAGATWLNITQPRGLPNVRVSSFDTQLGTNPRYLVASTYGRGIWRIALPPVVDGPPAHLVSMSVMPTAFLDFADNVPLRGSPWGWTGRRPQAAPS